MTIHAKPITERIAERAVKFICKIGGYETDHGMGFTVSNQYSNFLKGEL